MSTLTAEQRARKNARNREYMAQRRAAFKDAGGCPCCGETPADGSRVCAKERERDLRRAERDRPLSADACAHRWLIPAPSPGQPLLPSRCERCGAEREFAAFAPVGGWDGSNAEKVRQRASANGRKVAAARRAKAAQA